MSHHLLVCSPLARRSPDVTAEGAAVAAVSWCRAGCSWAAAAQGRARRLVAAAVALRLGLALRRAFSREEFMARALDPVFNKMLELSQMCRAVFLLCNDS